MTRGTIALVLGILSAVPVWAGQARDDFAFGFTAEPEGKNPVWELSLPDEVYRSVTRPDLGDLRVFNRDGLLVPHAVRRPTALLADRAAPQRLSVFPLRGRVDGGGLGRRLRIITDDRGEIVSAITEDLPVGEAERVIAYLIDTLGCRRCRTD
jgi:hypothetical protein